MALIFTLTDNDTFLRKTNAGLKLLTLLLLSILLTGSSYLTFSFILFLIVLIGCTHKLNLTKQLLKNKFLLFIALFIFISDYLNTKDYIISSFSCAKFLTLITLSIIFTSVTSPDETSRSLGNAISPILGRFGYHIASAIELTLALLPLIFSTSTELLDARKSRGESFFHHPIKAISSFSTALITSLLTKIEDYADALEARGYNLFIKRVSPPFNKRDLLLSFVILLTTGLIIYDKI